MIQDNQFQTASKIVRLGNAITWLRNQKTQSLGLTASQSEVIRYILKHDSQPITAIELIENLQLSQSTIAGILQRLEAKGFIIRETHQNDNRKSIILPTEAGFQLREALKETALETEEFLLNGMSETEKSQFGYLLQKALNNMNDMKQQKGGGSFERK